MCAELLSTYIWTYFVESVGRSEYLMWALAPTEIDTIYRHFIELLEVIRMRLNVYITNRLFESRSPSELPFEVGNSNFWMN